MSKSSKQNKESQPLPPKGRGPSSQAKPGGNWPSTTGEKSGRGRGNTPAKGK